MSPLSEQQIRSIWRMAPYMNGEKIDGSFGGTQIPKNMLVAATNSSTTDRLGSQPNPKHLYNSYDDFLIASTSDAKLHGNPQDVDVKERHLPTAGAFRSPSTVYDKGGSFSRRGAADRKSTCMECHACAYGQWTDRRKTAFRMRLFPGTTTEARRGLHHLTLPSPSTRLCNETGAQLTATTSSGIGPPAGTISSTGTILEIMNCISMCLILPSAVYLDSPRATLTRTFFEALETTWVPGIRRPQLHHRRHVRLHPQHESL